MKKFLSMALLTSSLVFSTAQVQAAIPQQGYGSAKAVVQDDIRLTDSGLAVVAPQALDTAQIREMQRQLSGQGIFAMSYYDGAIDGVWGPKTAAAVEKFQRDHGLWAEGLVTTSTVAQLGVSVQSAGNTYRDNTYRDVAPAAGDEAPATMNRMDDSNKGTESTGGSVY